MAYMSQEQKKQIAELLKPVLKKYNLKATLSVRNHMTLVCKIKAGSVDFFADLIPNEYNARCFRNRNVDVNVYHYKNNFNGKSVEVISEILAVLNLNNYDRSDTMSDYFDVGHYVDLEIGQFDKPYQVI